MYCTIPSSTSQMKCTGREVLHQESKLGTSVSASSAFAVGRTFYTYLVGLPFSNDYLKEKPERGAALVRSISRLVRDINSNCKAYLQLKLISRERKQHTCSFTTVLDPDRSR